MTVAGQEWLGAAYLLCVAPATLFPQTTREDSMEELSQDDLKVGAYAYALALEDSELGPPIDLLPNCERMRERGWLTRRMVNGEPFYEMTAVGFNAMEARRHADPANVSSN
jgi:hypothetical protein